VGAGDHSARAVDPVRDRAARDKGGAGGRGTVAHGPHLKSVGRPGEKGKGLGPGRKEDGPCPKE
jgi:hypothetical protein